MFGSESALKLRLLGKPTLTLDEVELRVSPPSAFKVLALVLLSGTEGISRKDLASKLWPQLDLKRGMTQVRYNLMLLREHLQVVDAAHVVNLDGQVLKAKVAVWIDVVEARAEIPTKAKLRNLVQPLVEGWNREPWTKESDEHADTLSIWFKRLGKEIESELCEKACSLYPVNTELAKSLVARYKAEGKDSQANEAIIRFEDAWVDRFGSVDIPDVSTFRPQEELHVQPKPGLRWGLLSITSTLVLAISAWLWNHKASDGKPAPEKPLPKIVSHSSLMLAGQQVERIILQSESDLIEPRRFCDGSIGFLQNDTPSRSIEVNGLQTKLSEHRLVDKAENATLDYMGTYVDASGKAHIVEKTPLYTRSGGIALLPDGSYLFQKACFHPLIDHAATYLLKGSQELEITTQQGTPVNCGVTFISGSRIYFRYTMGKAELWKNRSGYISYSFKGLDSTKITELGFEQLVQGELSDGTLVVRAQKTVVIDGDCNTSDTGEILLTKPTGKIIKLSYYGLTKFPSFATFGNVVFVQVATQAGTVPYVCFNSNGALVTPPRELGQVFTFFQGALRGNLLLTAKRNVPERKDLYDLWIVKDR